MWGRVPVKFPGWNVVRTLPQTGGETNISWMSDIVTSRIQAVWGTNVEYNRSRWIWAKFDMLESCLELLRVALNVATYCNGQNHKDQCLDQWLVSTWDDRHIPAKLRRRMLSGHRYSWQPQDKKAGNLEITKEMYGNDITSWKHFSIFLLATSVDM